MMKDKVVIITGGSSGMGQAMASNFIEAGAKVVITGRDKDRLNQAAKAINQDDCLHTVQMDVRSIEDVERSLEETLNRFEKLDCLVNNAAGNFFCPAEELSPNGWNTVVDIVLNGTWYMSQVVAKYWIKEEKPGSILNMVASSAWLGAPMNVHSAAAKAGVLNMTKTLAVEWGTKYKIRVNALAPGIIENTGGMTQLFGDEKILEKFKKTIPLNRLGRLKEISNLATYILSDQGAYFNGECLTLDGGQALHTGFFS